MTDEQGIHESAVTLVEEAIGRLGIDPVKARAQVDERTVQWAVRRGSARISIAVHRGEGSQAGTLRVAAPVIAVPDAPHRLALFQHVLELNARELVGAAFGLVGDEVVVVAERSLADLSASEVDAAIRGVGRIADTYDDSLATRFGAKRASD